MKKKKWMFVAALAAIACGWFGWTASHRAKTDPVGENKIVTVDRGPVRQIVTASGRISANFEVDIKCKASGEVINLPYDISDFVKKGALVLELDPTDEQRQVTQQQSALTAAQRRVDKANQTVTISEQTLLTDQRQAQTALHSAEVNAHDLRSKAARMQKLLENQLVSPEQAETAETSALRAELAVDDAKNAIEALQTRTVSIEMDRNEVKLAELQVEAAETDLAEAKQRLTDTKVMAPIDGVVTTRPAEIGTIVSSGITNIGGGTSIMTLSDLSRLFVLAPVDEADIGRVQRDQKVVVSCDAFPDRKFEGKILRIASKGLTQANIVTFEVKIEVLGEGKELLRPEMTTDLEIVVAERENVVRVPTEAVRTREKDKKHFVLIPVDAPATTSAAASAPAIVQTAPGVTTQPKIATAERDVEIGADDGKYCEIVSGLKEGDRVVIDVIGQGQWAKLKARGDFE